MRKKNVVSRMTQYDVLGLVLAFCVEGLYKFIHLLFGTPG